MLDFLKKKAVDVVKSAIDNDICTKATEGGLADLASGILAGLFGVAKYEQVKRQEEYRHQQERFNDIFWRNQK